MSAAWLRNDVHDNAEAKAAFGAVSIQNDGQFLVYMREGDHVLCVIYRGKLTLHIIKPGADGILTANKKVFGESKTIDALITALSAEPPPSGWPVRLTTSPPRKQNSCNKKGTAEFQAVNLRETAASSHRLHGDAEVTEGSSLQAFQRQNLNSGDTVLTKNELSLDSMRRMDLNGDGQVSVMEFMAAQSPPKKWNVGQQAADRAALHSVIRPGQFNGTAAARDAEVSRAGDASNEIDRLTAELAAQKAAYAKLLASSNAQLQQMNAQISQIQMQHQAELNHMAQQFRMEMERILHSSKAGLHAQVRNPEKKGKSDKRNSNFKLQRVASREATGTQPKQMSDAERRMLVKEAELTGKGGIKRTLSKRAQCGTEGCSSNLIAVESGGVFLTAGGYVEREGRLADRD